ncbi:guanylate-binding protein 1-like [Ruditapes philippinarum]|uniref:guanylate-binding protein 1-like n=1 Tax=Ruditapes philippinarum TaxID=129788 RepID=UPI00295BB5A5|nr:guanylate-binding protein 1-like [Ruditapes philippinarum]
MDKDDNFSDKQTNMDHRSKIAFFDKLDIANQPKKTETENLRRIYRQVQPATMMDDEFPQSSGKIAQTRSRWSTKDLEIFQHPMCLIGAVYVKNQKGQVTKTHLEIQEEALDQISKIDLPIVVVAVVGLYRTGKSYLMNRLAESNTGFALGDTIESKTKGIWAWCKLHPTQSNTVLLLLDTEGLGDVAKGDRSHDNKIFILATLLCNCLVYNMKGVFDNDAVVKLTFVTEMAKSIKFRGKASEDNQWIGQILPDFVLCLRDFSLKLISAGKKISENEYLEQSLADNECQAEEFNKPRECIRKYFRKRECFAFPVPGDGDVLENLETLRLSDLSTRFKEATARFVSYIYSLPPKELLVSTPVKGRMFKVLVEEYVTAIRQGAVPDVDGAFLAVAKIENEKTKKIAVDNFEKQLQKTKLPVSSDVLMTAFTEAETEALNYFRKNVVHDKDFEYEHQAQIEMDRIWNQVKEENDVKVRTMSRTKLQEAYEKNMKLKIQNDDYKTAGGYRKYQCDVESLQKEYFSSLRGFNENEILRSWHEFVTDMKETEAKIVQADDDLSQKEKEEEQKRNEENTRQLLKRQEEANKEEFEKQKKELEDHFKTIENERKKKEEADEKKLEELVHKKMEEEAAKKELESLRAEKKDRKKRGFLTRLGDALWNT